MNLRPAKERSTCQVCGMPVTLPPGVYYRGRRMHKHEADRYRRIDHDTEVKIPRLNVTEQELQRVLELAKP